MYQLVERVVKKCLSHSNNYTNSQQYCLLKWKFKKYDFLVWSGSFQYSTHNIFQFLTGSVEILRINNITTFGNRKKILIPNTDG